MTKIKVDEIVIEGVTYVPKASQPVLAAEVEGLKLVIVRTQFAGVYMGYLKSLVNGEAELLQARNLWYWSGAATLAQLAEEGVKNPKECKFPQTLAQLQLLRVGAVYQVTEQAKKSIDSVPVWKS